MQANLTSMLGSVLAGAIVVLGPTAPASADLLPSLEGCEGPLWRCSGDDQLHFSWQQTPFTGVQVDTGWLPQGSNVQLRFGIRLAGNSSVEFDAGTGARWNADSMQLGLLGEEEGGILQVGYGLQITAQFRFNVSVLGQNFQWEGNLPTPINLPSDLLLAGETSFRPWLLPGAEPVGISDTTARVNAFTVGLDSIGIDVPGIGGHVALQAEATLDAQYSDTEVGISGNLLTYHGQEIDFTDDIVNEDFGQTLPLDVEPRGQLEYSAGVNLYPHVQLKVLGITVVNQDLFALHVDIPSTSTVVSYQSDAAIIPLPELEYAREVQMEDGESMLSIANHGQAPLFLEPVDWPAELQSLADLIEVPAGESIDLHIVAALGAKTDHLASLAFDSNDPNQPHLLVALLTDPTDPDSDSEPGQSEPDEDLNPALDSGVGGCGCQSTGPGASGAWMLILFALVILGRRRSLVS